MWICADPLGHIQAIGRDARRRKQYRYHPRWTAVRDATKYARLEAFGRALPALRRQVARDLRQPPLSRERVLATVVSLLEKTLIRVGNDEYARANGSFGLTTLKNRHVQVRGARVRFKFRAKSGVLQTIELEDASLAKSVKRCQDLPGQELFQYLDSEGARQSVGSADVNAYLRERDWRRLHGQGLPDVGGYGHGGARAWLAGHRGGRHRAQATGDRRHCRGSRIGWATHPPSAGAATSIPGSSARISTVSQLTARRDICARHA